MEKKPTPKQGVQLTPLVSLLTTSLVMLCVFFPFGFSENHYANMLICDFLLLLVVAWLLRMFRLPFEFLGFHRLAPTEYMLGIAAGLLIIGLTYGLSMLAEGILGPVSDEITRAYEELKPRDITQMIVLGIEVILITPFLEEILFRSFIYRGFRSYGFLPAVFISSLIYGFFFVNPWVVLPGIFMGVVLCWVYERTGNLSVVFLAHMVANIIAFLELAGVVKLGN